MSFFKSNVHTPTWYSVSGDLGPSYMTMVLCENAKNAWKSTKQKMGSRVESFKNAMALRQERQSGFNEQGHACYMELNLRRQ